MKKLLRLAFFIDFSLVEPLFLINSQHPILKFIKHLRKQLNFSASLKTNKNSQHFQLVKQTSQPPPANFQTSIFILHRNILANCPCPSHSRSMPIFYKFHLHPHYRHYYCNILTNSIDCIF